MRIIQSHFNMEEIKDITNKAIRIEINYQNPEELIELYSSKKLISYIQFEVLCKIEYAVKNKLKRIEIFNILNMALIIELKRENFKEILQTINTPYIEAEDFETCSRIQKLINQL